MRSHVVSFFSSETGPKAGVPREFLRMMLGKLILVRLAILSVILGIASWGALQSGLNSALVFRSLGLLYALSALNALLVRRLQNLRALGYAQLVIDVILASLAIYLSGSSTTNFLYLLVIAGAAALFRKHGAVIIASFSAIAYAVLQSGVFPRMDGTTTVANPNDILLVYVSFVIFALLSAYLAEQMQKLGLIAASHEEHLSELTNRQQQLFDDISEGIITLDVESAITSINQTARAIIGLRQLDAEQLVGQRLTSVLKDLGVQGGDEILKNTDGGNGEITLKNRDNEIHLNYTLRPLSDRSGTTTGRLLIFSDVSHVKSMEERLHLHERMTKLLAETTEPISDRPLSRVHIIGESPVMRHVFTLVERVAASEASVLVTGESGTGKELIARAIHAHGPRRAKSFVAINCGAIPENLIESELFGHKKGSFTGAISDNIGLFRQANGGTIFLDEIGELPLPMQTKLLRVLQEKKVRSVGDVHDAPVDVRVVAATNRDLKKEIAKGGFREDLFYRLNVVNIMVPPLRERREDIPLLVRHFMGQYCDKDAVLPQISSEALQLLMNYNFPGNIRELENVIERALVLGGQAILADHLAEDIRRFMKVEQRERPNGGSNDTAILVLPIDLDGELQKLERDLILKALGQTNGVKKHAAELLGLNFRSFRYRLKKYGMSEDSPGDSDDNKPE